MAPATPTAASPRSLRPALAVAATAVIALLLAACGGGGSGDAGADPASIAPKTASVYAVATIRPEGDQKAAVEAIAKKFGVADPGKQIADAFDKSDSKSDVSFKDDIEPWLGNKAAVVVTGFASGGGNPSAVGIVASKDTGKTQDAIDKIKDETSKSYKDVDYKLDKDGTATALVGDFFVFGNEAALKQVIDADDAGSGLADSDTYKQVAGGNTDKLGFGYVDLKTLLAGLNASGKLPPAQAGALRQALGGGELQPVTFSLSATPTSVTLEGSAQSNKALPSQQVPALVGDLPGDSWFAFGASNVGKALNQAVAQFETGLGGQAVTQVKTQFRQQTGLDLDRDVLPALGSFAAFARGASPLEVGGGIVIQSDDPAAAARVVAKLPGLLKRMGASGVKATPVAISGARGVKITSTRGGFPGAVNAVVKGDKLVIAYSDAATRDALAPQEKLADSPDYKTASESIGGATPAIYLAFAPIVDLVTSSGSSSSAQVKQYLGQLTTLAIGGKTEGNRSTVKFVVGLK